MHDQAIRVVELAIANAAELWINGELVMVQGMYGQLVSAIQLAMHEVLIGMLLIEQVPFCLLCTWLGGW